MIMPLQPPKDKKRCTYPECSIHSSCIGECERKSQSETIAELMALKSELTGDLIAERTQSATLRAALEALNEWLTDYGMAEKGGAHTIIALALAASGEE